MKPQPPHPSPAAVSQARQWQHALIDRLDDQRVLRLYDRLRAWVLRAPWERTPREGH